MLVSELQKELEKMPPDAPVLWTPDGMSNDVGSIYGLYRDGDLVVISVGLCGPKGESYVHQTKLQDQEGFQGSSRSG